MQRDDQKEKFDERERRRLNWDSADIEQAKRKDGPLEIEPVVPVHSMIMGNNRALTAISIVGVIAGIVVVAYLAAGLLGWIH